MNNRNAAEEIDRNDEDEKNESEESSNKLS